MPNIIWKGPVPNYWAGRNGKNVIAICDHIMQGTLGSTDGWFHNAAAEASSTYGIGTDGTIYQWVKEEDSAWANGVVNVSGGTPAWLSSLSRQGVNINTVTISIEHAGYTGNAMPEAQYQATLWLHKQIIPKYNIPLDREHIIGHYQVDIVNRSGCPGTGFPWTRLLNDLVTWAAGNNTDNPHPIIVPDDKVLTMNGHVIGHGFLARYMEMGGNDLTACLRNVGLPLTDEFSNPDGITRQVFERYVMEYNPKEPNEFWKISGAFTGQNWLDLNQPEVKLPKLAKGPQTAAKSPTKPQVNETGEHYAYKEKGQPETPKARRGKGAAESEPVVDPQRARANLEEEG
jgi:hypothetical protein